ncbi:hypothetical protein [Bradyrhizobium guangdongense]|uniref:Uncharacterized protein n=1 Tax=Bradyrhizobium guangdongense TaxID=1325090 RepID=A0A410VD76_9BRAD|nr:hypothetical protein [Bradyrhizobium guangdongense]QAU41671.1 hypothetical protein X265_31285 [Bradyrhizobium guangdongense]QOZ62733.1 hypothetical protein XH86_31325 [Bradyrhizobium guangdongense]GGI25016.1 hypothetical protein GCM10010987_32280 [Bradyrhizobium guangdongense]
MPIRRVHYPLQSDAAHIEMAREAVREAMEVLRQSTPDTFLGRETYKPFPRQNKEDNIGHSNGSLPQASSQDE